MIKLLDIIWCAVLSDLLSVIGSKIKDFNTYKIVFLRTLEDSTL